jgi:hypothetical protein
MKKYSIFFLVVLLLVGFALFRLKLPRPNILPTTGVDDFMKAINNCLDKNFLPQKTSLKESGLRNTASYQVALKSRTFTPEENSNLALQCLASLPNDRKYHALVQLYQPPSETQKKVLETKGISLQNYIPDNAWFAVFTKSISQNDIQDISLIIRWVGSILPSDRSSAEIRNNQAGSWAKRGSNVMVEISFFSDVSNIDVENLIARYNGTINNKIEYSNKYIIEIENNLQEKLSSEDSIRWIDQISPPPTTP